MKTMKEKSILTYFKRNNNSPERRMSITKTIKLKNSRLINALKNQPASEIKTPIFFRSIIN